MSRRRNNNRNGRRNNRRRNNNNRGQRTNQQVTYIARNPTLGKVIRKICVNKDVLYVTTLASALFFRSATLSFRTLGSLVATSSDFLGLAADYTVARIHSFKISITRIVGEIAFNTAGVNMSPVHCAFYPSRTSASGLNAVECETALVVPGLTPDVFTKQYPIVPVTSLVTLGGTDYFFNPGSWIDVSLFALIPGVIILGWDGASTLPTVNTDLFSFEIYADVSFASPI